ncbi:Mid1 protein [Saccharomycopsis crataegensis]|uniref:Mid1 protein n=1 Tax=Saccharomycopsis crataegensis TaxID=43959 RepID=A0AAV5QWA0_9ASCO|nr:Mid1 protein [Saccharomycopsis crataegensis]
MIWQLSCLLLVVFAQSVASSPSQQFHFGAGISHDDLWRECYTKHLLKSPNQLENCLNIDCSKIDLKNGEEESEICYEIQSSLRKRGKRSEIDTSLGYGYAVADSLRSFYASSFQRLIQNVNEDGVREVNGKFFTKVADKDVQVLYPRSSLINDIGSTGNSTSLSDWEPISDIIGSNETKYYQFNVNTTSTGLSSFYHILVFLSGNICTLPKDVGLTNQLIVDYGFDINLVQNISNATYSSTNFSHGYMKGLAKHDIPSNPNNTFVTMYIKVSAPATQNLTDIWDYELGISQKDLVYQWDNRTWISLVDSDDTSALLVTGNFSSAPNLNVPSFNSTKNNYYEVYLYPYNSDVDYFRGLTNSWCAIRNGPAILTSDDMELSYTNRSEMLRQQFYIPDLNTSTSYMGFALETDREGNYGGTVFKKIEFSTKDSAACQLIYNLEFCSNVAYSVPAKASYSDSQEKANLKYQYDNNTSDIYQNFSKALNQIACETESDAIFSPLTSCDKCAESYKNWLCSVTIPRCTTDDQPEYVFRNSSSSRTSFVNTEIQPLSYYEILPCYNSCYALVRNCPADFGFSCPDNVSTISGSTYYWDTGASYLTCNFIGATSDSSWGIHLVTNTKLQFFCILFILGFIL